MSALPLLNSDPTVDLSQTPQASAIDFINHLVPEADKANFFKHAVKDRMGIAIATITPEKAKTILQYQKNFQRVVNTKHARSLALLMEENQFMRGNCLVVGSVSPYLTPDAIALSWAYLIDGQHRLRGVVDSGVTVTMPVLFLMVRDENELRNEAGGIDHGKSHTKANHAQIGQIKQRMGLDSASDAVAYCSGSTTLVRLGLDAESPFYSDDHNQSHKMFAIYDHYAAPGKSLLNIYNYGKSVITEDDTKKKFKHGANLRNIRIFAPLLAYALKEMDRVENFMSPFINGEMHTLHESQKIFLSLIRDGFVIDARDYKKITGNPYTDKRRLGGARSQDRVVAGVFSCLKGFGNRRFNEGRYHEEVLRTVDMRDTQDLIWNI